MRKFLIVFGLMLAFFSQAFSQNFISALEQWNDVINAISYVESKCDSTIISKDGSCVGLLQIKKIVVDDCNQYLKMLGSNKRYTYDDRLSAQKSKEMFCLIQMRYNKSNSIEGGIRLWCSGSAKPSPKSNAYYQKVMKRLTLK